MSSRNPRLRDALFTLADSRGNNPHGTREDAVHEGRRLNAGRYETVEQIDRALDARSRRVKVPGLAGTATEPVRTQASSPTTPQGASLLEAAFLIALGAGVAYLLSRKDASSGDEADDVDDEGVDEGVDESVATETSVSAPIQNPSQPPLVLVLPQSSSHEPAVQAPAVPVAVPPPVEKKTRRKKSSSAVSGA